MRSPQTLNRQREQAIFHRLVSADLHEDWWQASLPAGLPWRPLGKRAHDAVSLHLRERWGLEELDNTALNKDPTLQALCQLPGSRLSRLVLYLGIVFAGGEVRRALDRREIERYRLALGEDLYRFAMQGAPLFGQTEATTATPVGPAALPTRARDTGLTALHRVIAPAGSAVVRRIELKLPPSWTGRPPSGQGLQLALPALHRITVRLLRYIEPQWTEHQPTNNPSYA